MRVRCEAEGSTQHEIEKTAEQRQKTAKILAAMLVFLLAEQPQGYRIQLSDSTGREHDGNRFRESEEVDEEQTVSEKSAGETTGIPEKREAQEAAPEETVQVYICGAVASPGVYTLPGGSRVVQAVEAAGGFLPDAEEKILNLARKIEDGEQITVWTREEAENMEITETPQQNTGGTEPGFRFRQSQPEHGRKRRTDDTLRHRREPCGCHHRLPRSKRPVWFVEEIMNIEGIKGKMFEKIRGSIEV